MECVLCGQPSDQPGRFCSGCVGPNGSVAGGQGATLEFGPAQMRPLRILQWPITAGLLAASGLAGMRTAALVLSLDAVVRRQPSVTHLGLVQQRVVMGGAGLFALVGVLWLAWWAVAYANLRPLGVMPREVQAWAVLAWLVPLADVVVPQRIADELWRGSDPWTPLGWRAGKHARRSPIVRAWWLAWWGAGALLAGAEVALLRVAHPTRSVTIGIDAALIASAVLVAVAGVAAIGLVIGVTARQGERARLMVQAGLVPSA